MWTLLSKVTDEEDIMKQDRDMKCGNEIGVCPGFEVS